MTCQFAGVGELPAETRVCPDADVNAIVMAAAAAQRVAQAEHSGTEQCHRARKTLGNLLSLLAGLDPPVAIKFTAFRDGVSDSITMVFTRQGEASFTVPFASLDQKARSRVADALDRRELHPGCLSSTQEES